MTRRGILGLSMVFLAACGAPEGVAPDASHDVLDADVRSDAGMDAGPASDSGWDAGSMDAGVYDAGALDDAGPAGDAGTADAAISLDAGLTDAGTSDAGTAVDAGLSDAGVPDAGPVDAGLAADAGPPAGTVGAAVDITGGLCALDEVGNFWCWERWGTTGGRAPVRFLGRGFVDAAGTCARRADGTLACADFTALAMMPITDGAGPLRVDAIGEISTFERGCGIRAAQLFCWRSGAAQNIATALPATHVTVGASADPDFAGFVVVLRDAAGDCVRGGGFTGWPYASPIGRAAGCGRAAGTDGISLDGAGTDCVSNPSYFPMGGTVSYTHCKTSASSYDLPRAIGTQHVLGVSVDCALAVTNRSTCSTRNSSGLPVMYQTAAAPGTFRDHAVGFVTSFDSSLGRVVTDRGICHGSTYTDALGAEAQWVVCYRVPSAAPGSFTLAYTVDW